MNARSIRRCTLVWPLVSLFASPALAQVGTNYCGPAVPNSSGQAAVISALGSADLGINATRLTLVAADLPANKFGLFLVSRAQGFTPNPNGSLGTLCLGGSIGRNSAVGQVLTTGATSRMELPINLALIPQGAGLVPVLAGETWNFQSWFRDVGPGGASASNFSDGLEVQFTNSCVGCGPIAGMVSIPAGTFRMGSDAPNTSPYFNHPNSQPSHDVTISYSFWMGQYEVTQAEYQAVMGTNPSWFSGASRPVERVTWYEARAYCAALTSHNAASIPSGYEYRLPTEAEWEYACRAATTTEFHYGAALFCSQARFFGSKHSGVYCGVTNLDGTVAVGRYVPNAFGLYDMHGNVWEWCLDSFANYSGQAVVDPFVTGSFVRVVRGGSWASRSDFCRSARRLNEFPSSMSRLNGFRVVLAPALVP